jgi:RNA polymerase sigma-70 factor (ECF subfamily)
MGAVLAEESATAVRSVPGGTLTDEEVAARVLAGETGLFEVLMRRYNRRLFRVARAIVRDEGEAEDIMQETYVRAFAALGQFQGRASWATWLTRIAVNEALARLRRRGRFVGHGDEAIDGGEDQMESEQAARGVSGGRCIGPEETTAARELSGFVERAVDDLPDSYRVVFMLREVEELSTTETAACLDISEDLVKVRLHRARVELRRLLDARLGAATREVFDFHLSRCDRIVAAVMARLPGVRSAGETTG